MREWAATLPVGPIQDAAWKAIGVRGELPPDSLQGRARDKLLEGHAASYLADSAALSPMLAKIATITDPAIRRRAFEITMWGALHGGRPAVSATAKEALEKANVPADWKAALRDSLSR